MDVARVYRAILIGSVAVLLPACTSSPAYRTAGDSTQPPTSPTESAKQSDRKASRPSYCAEGYNYHGEYACLDRSSVQHQDLRPAYCDEGSVYSTDYLCLDRSSSGDPVQATRAVPTPRMKEVAPAAFRDLTNASTVILPKTPTLRQNFRNRPPRTIRILPLPSEHHPGTTYTAYRHYYRTRALGTAGTRGSSSSSRAGGRPGEWAAGAAGGVVLHGCVAGFFSGPLWAVTCPMSIMLIPFAAVGGVVAGATADAITNSLDDSLASEKNERNQRNIHLGRDPESRLFDPDHPLRTAAPVSTPSEEIAGHLALLLNERTPHSAYIDTFAESTDSSPERSHDHSLGVDVTRLGFLIPPRPPFLRTSSPVSPSIHLFVEVRIPYYQFTNEGDVLTDYQYIQYLSQAYKEPELTVNGASLVQNELARAYLDIADHIVGGPELYAHGAGDLDGSTNGRVIPLMDLQFVYRCNDLTFNSRAIFRIQPDYRSVQTCTGSAYEQFDNQGNWEKVVSSTELPVLFEGRKCSAQIMGQELGGEFSCTEIFAKFESYFGPTARSDPPATPVVESPQQAATGVQAAPDEPAHAEGHSESRTVRKESDAPERELTCDEKLIKYGFNYVCQ